MDLDALFADVPDVLREELVSTYSNIEDNYRGEHWEPSELNGGKFCEVVYTILKGFVDGNYSTKAFKPGNMVDACKALEQAGSGVPRSIRIQIPRMIISLYEIRNNRGVGHVGGDVNPNMMDAICVLQMSKWILAELIRVFHNVSTEDAQVVVEAISERKLALIWSINGRHRILDTSLSMKDATLVLLYTGVTGVSEADLVDHLEHSNSSVYRRDILQKAHKDRLLEYDSSKRMVYISPKGLKYVEDKILKFTG